MLPLKYRLKKNNDFLEILLKSRPQHGSFLSLREINNNLKFPRIGFVVSKKISNKANQRNLIKRRMREAVRPLLPEMANKDIMILARQGSLGKDFEEIKKEIKNLFLKAKIIK